MTSLTEKEPTRRGGRGARRRIQTGHLDERRGAVGAGGATAEVLIDLASTRALEEKRHFDVVAAARTASLIAVGEMATRAFCARLAASST